VKRYSSGMYVRLAFAVAAHMDTEILLIDEVLAVGDASFQKKCIGKMGNASHEGKTILFVSHNMDAISSLCNRCIWLSNGTILKDGEAREITSEYQSMMYSHIDSSEDLTNIERYGNGKSRFTSVTITPYDKQISQNILQVGQDLEITTNIIAYQDIIDANVAVIIYEQSGYRLIDVNTAIKNSHISLKQGQSATIKFRLKNVLCKPGTYLLGLWLGRANVEDIDGIKYAKQFQIETNIFTSESSYKFPGTYLCEYDHTVEIK
jgi:lipopolysaccharide transport system ATP-binding protein